MNFSETKLNISIQKAITDLGFKILTPVQQEAIPYLIESDNDLIALAQTGTGKTAAFGLPLLNNINVSRKFPQALILCPTRELCLQISKDINSYAKYIKKFKLTSVYGGSNILSQIKSLKSGTQIVVGTPGRVIDLIKRKALKLQDIETLILDEADEMLNMGFKDDLDTILKETPKEKQTLLFSATMPKEVMRISKNYMMHPHKIEVSVRNKAAQNVDHHYYMVNAKDKYQALRRICDVNINIYAIVFCRTRRETADIARKLNRDGYNVDAIHGDLSQSQRDSVMNKFRKKQIEILVATDVAARGIDINDLTHVINYNIPEDNEVYIHRSGRTGRAGKKGISIIIAHNRDGRKLNSLEKMIKRNFTVQKVPTGNQICEIQLLNLVEKVANTEINHQIDKYISKIEEKLKHLEREQLIKHFVSREFNRFLSYYKDAPELNIKSISKNQKNNKKSIHFNKKDRTGIAEEGYTRFFINIGSGNEKAFKAHNLIGLINDHTRSKNIPFGKIDIMRNFSFFEIPSNFESDILGGLRNAKWNRKKIIVEISQIPQYQHFDKSRNSRNKKTKKTLEFKKNSRKNSRDKISNTKQEISKNISSSSKYSFKNRYNAKAKRKRNS